MNIFKRFETRKARYNIEETAQYMSLYADVMRHQQALEGQRLRAQIRSDSVTISLQAIRAYEETVPANLRQVLKERHRGFDVDDFKEELQRARTIAE